ncbi:MAG TPA: glycosyltransferase [Candidatus Paceibacterota bacterium]|nr:glycosyltransferase [Candidatus Paceibacterota bacterium]
MISIIIPTLNEKSVIESTLRAIRDGLTDIPFELIVTDSASTDGTQAIAARYATVIEHDLRKEKKTIAWNKDQGAAAAHGEFYVFIDADVQIPNPNAFFKTALARFAADPKIVALTTNLWVFPETATLMDKIVFGMVNLDHWFNNNVTRFGSASGEFQMIRADAFNKLHGYREHLAVAEDNDMFSRLASIGRTRFETSLKVYHTGRRAHELGWGKVLWDWFINYFSVKLLNRSHDKEWRVIR